ncbi:2TM domain-containing protein [Robiginitalea sp. M366]|uniref:2TM domain-containing protein n=1 Tax=Robiginitalea aestuariiviva TaxID=3036903 RepID=UPI00240E90E5|nr:2TM domain-containing protein [Robiginitalea aestuariiviva]MDG1573411.1 2TM domain-containing protein [Robiginitalea aestuariiviva]
MENRIESDRYLRARRRVDCIKGFYHNLLAYLIVIPFLAWLNWRTTHFPWVIFPALGWGMGLAMHGLRAFGYNLFLGPDWENRKIREFMSKDDF